LTSELTGDWLRNHTTPDDLVTVRGFQPEIYAVAKRHHGGRFFWTTFLTNPARRIPPRGVAARGSRRAPRAPAEVRRRADAHPSWPRLGRILRALGYRTATVIYEFTIMERVPAAPAPPAP